MDSLFFWRILEILIAGLIAYGFKVLYNRPKYLIDEHKRDMKRYIDDEFEKYSNKTVKALLEMVKE